MIIERENRLLSADGKSRLYIKIWKPEHSSAKAIVKLTHGICEHIGRYEEFARFLAENGYAVIGNDNLGHGQTAASFEELGCSDEPNGWDCMVDDLIAVTRYARQEFPGIPCAQFGHSLGSFLVRSLLYRYPDEVDAAIICGTATQPAAMLNLGIILANIDIKLHGTRSRSKLLHYLSIGSLNSKVENAKSSADWISTDAEIVDKYLKDEFTQFFPTSAYFREMFMGMRSNQKASNLAKMRKGTPLLFIAGEKDPIGNDGKGVKAAYEAFKRAGCSDVGLTLYEGCRHEVLNDAHRDRAFADLLSWLTLKLDK